MTGDILPAIIIFWPTLAAAAGYGIGRKNERARNLFMIAATASAFVLCLIPAFFGSAAELYVKGAAGLSIHLNIDGFRILYGAAAGFLWFVTALFSPEYFANSHNRDRYWFFNMMTLSSALGVFFSADLITAFLFFEVMSFTSYALVAHDESPGAIRAGETYLAIAIIGGLAMLMGILLLWRVAGTLTFAQLYEICSATQDKSPFYLPGALLIAGFGAKAGLFPLHIWLPRAHSAAPAPASALLSGILTKTGVFGVIIVSRNIFPGDLRWGAALAILAAVTMLLGGVLGVFSNNLKRTLACSSVSQIGIIVTGIAMLNLLGDHGTLAAGGVVLHMLNHSLIKLVLFISAGVVYINLHELNLDKIRGFGRGKPLFLFVFTMGALGICGAPLWSGYISKTLLHESIVEAAHLFSGLPLEVPLRLLDGVFVFTGGLTIAYMLKLFVVLFVEKGEEKAAVKDGVKADVDGGKAGCKKRYISRPAAVALTVSAALIPLAGCFTGISEALIDKGLALFNVQASAHTAHYFTWQNLRGIAVSAAIGAAVYFIVVRRLTRSTKTYPDVWPKWFDLENMVYRPFLRGLLKIVTVAAHTAASFPDALIQLVLRIFMHLNRKSYSPVQWVLRTILRPNRKPYAPRKFLSRHYWVSGRQQQSYTDEPAIAGGFSLGLLFVSVGICLVIIYAVIQGLGTVK